MAMAMDSPIIKMGSLEIFKWLGSCMFKWLGSCMFKWLGSCTTMS